MKHFVALSLLSTTALMAHGQMECLDRYLTDPLTYTDIVTSTDQVSQPRDLDFKPNSNELWVMNKGGTNGGSMVIVRNAGMPGQTDEYRKDTHSSHFMRVASAMAFSENGEWAAVSEIQSTAGGTSTFMGPGLWSGDLDIFATVFQNNWVNGFPLGSHRDMLHQSPFAMGIASDSAKVYWVMDGHFGNIVRYDFVEDHGPGYDDHSAGKIWRYTDVPVARVANIPSHMVVDHENRWLYYIDGVSKQIRRLDMNTGTETGNLTAPNETLAAYKKVEGATVEVVDSWASGQPCGIAYTDGRLIVSDNTSGDIKLYDVSGVPALMGTITTGQPGIMGLAIGPDARIWFANYAGNKVVRIDPLPMPNDAAITAVVSPATTPTNADFYSPAFDVCASAIDPVVTLTNAGVNDITSVEIHFQVDGGAAIMYSWTGLLAPGASTNVTLPPLALTNGAHRLNVWTEMPNGMDDMNPLNNELQGSFRLVAPVLSVPYAQDFSTTTFPPTGWNYVHFNPNNQFTRSAASGFGAGSGSAKMDHYSGSMDITGQLDYLMSPRLDLSGAPTGTLLQFSVAYKQYNSSSVDRLLVKVSTDCGGTWSALYDKEGSTLSTTAAGTGAFTPTAAQWRTESVDLASVIGRGDVLFMFVTESNFGNNMYLDDVNVGAIVGVDELASAGFAVFPNPSNGRFFLRAAVEGNMALDVFSIDGMLVHQQRWAATQGAQLEMDLSSLAGGVYLVSINDASGNSYQARIVIQ
ncbi:MAG: choice-of-anchor J domain-containing protein [Flavobacteriales bacterium]